ncbi:MAG: hypothetical protein INF79_01275 [Roseomonas sp.]|nr:hypothetical protein [Roseomonas sp.]
MFKYDTYHPRFVAKQVADQFVAGSGDLVSAGTAHLKVKGLEECLQTLNQQPDVPWNGQDIAETDLINAIAYARDKKRTKERRRAFVGTTKLGAQVAGTVAGATVGTVAAPVVGTALGAAGGFVFGTGLSGAVSAADFLKRGAKRLYKEAMGTQGVHRLQAARALVYPIYEGRNHVIRRKAATKALLLILGDEFDEIIGDVLIEGELPFFERPDINRIADRLKSN